MTYLKATNTMNLPTDVVILILKKCSPKDIFSIGCTSQKYFTLILSNDIGEDIWEAAVIAVVEPDYSKEKYPLGHFSTFRMFALECFIGKEINCIYVYNEVTTEQLCEMKVRIYPHSTIKQLIEIHQRKRGRKFVVGCFAVIFDDSQTLYLSPEQQTKSIITTCKELYQYQFSIRIELFPKSCLW